jgi:hypothetical protein
MPDRKQQGRVSDLANTEIPTSFAFFMTMRYKKENGSVYYDKRDALLCLRISFDI